MKKLKRWLNRTDLITLKILILRFWKKLFHGHHAAFFPAQFCNSVWKQCNTLQLNCNLPSQYWNLVSLLTVHQTITLNFLIMKTSYESNKKTKNAIVTKKCLWKVCFDYEVFLCMTHKNVIFDCLWFELLKTSKNSVVYYKSFSVTSISCFETTFSYAPIGNVYIFGWLPEWTH